MIAVDRRRPVRHGTPRFSTRRWYATVSAPGVDVVIADPDRTYYEGWGTSAASAYVSGAVALLRSAHPGSAPAQIKQVLEDTARDSPRGGRDDALGSGFIDPAAALAAAGETEARPAAPTAAAYPHAYFGSGPAPATTPPTTTRSLGDGLATAFAATGAPCRGRRAPRSPPPPRWAAAAAQLDRGGRPRRCAGRAALRRAPSGARGLPGGHLRRPAPGARRAWAAPRARRQALRRGAAGPAGRRRVRGGG